MKRCSAGAARPAPPERPETSQAEAEKRERTRLRNRGGQAHQGCEKAEQVAAGGSDDQNLMFRSFEQPRIGPQRQIPAAQDAQVRGGKDREDEKLQSSGLGKVIVPELQAV